jgi:hypothetical protein
MSVRKVSAAALVGATVWAAAACSNPAPPYGKGTAATTATAPAPAVASGTGSAPASAAPASAASTARCASAPPALVGKDLKLAVGKVTAIAEGPVTVCAYAGRYEVLVRYQSGENATEFAQARQSQARLNQSVGTVKGLGDIAYLASYTAAKPFSYTLGSLKGAIAIFITSPASPGAESALMTDLLKKV